MQKSKYHLQQPIICRVRLSEIQRIRFPAVAEKLPINCDAIMYEFMQDASTQIIFLVGEKWKCVDIQLPEFVDADLEESWQFWNSEEIKVRKILSF